MKILYITSSVEDYLSDSVFLGFRELFHEKCVDYPKCEILYKGSSANLLEQVRGKGFTLYSGILADIEVDRFNIEQKIRSGYFDLVIISDIQRQYGWFVQFRPWLKKSNAIIMDGGDTTAPYPARGLWWRRMYYWFLPRAHEKFLYFKREWAPETRFNIIARLLPKKIIALLPYSKNLRTISFCIPDEKIVKELPSKVKDFTKHIVDPEVAKQIEGSTTLHAFESEKDYYEDLQASRFGITTKRAGWDCLRHYEIAANGAVICFRNLNLKPTTCAPHGLIENVNCISYLDYGDLMAKINLLTENSYKEMQLKCWEWAKANSSVKRAEEILQQHSQAS